MSVSFLSAVHARADDVALNILDEPNPSTFTGRIIDLRKGHPKPCNLPHHHMAAACRLAAARLDEANEDVLPLQYSPTEYGTSRYLKTLANFLSKAYGGCSPVFEDWLLTTTGVSHGLELAVSSLTKPGDVCWMESPSYFLAHQIFVDHHLSIRGVPSDEHGLDVDSLARCLADTSLGPPPAVLYVVPTHGNPTGATLSRERREALLDLARRYHFIVLADEVYHLLDWTDGEAEALPPRLLALDKPYLRRVGSGGGGARGDQGAILGGDASYLKAQEAPAGVQAEAACGHVISVSSHTKILAPGLKLGWLEASPSMLRRIARRGYLDSGGSVAPFTSEVVACLLEAEAADGDEGGGGGGGGGGTPCGQEKVLRALVTDYARSCAALCASVRAAPRQLALASAPPTGGFFAWVRLIGLPEGIGAQQLLPYAQRRHGVVFLPGEVCAPCDPRSCASYVRLCFAYESAEDVAEGVRRLAAAVDDLCRRPPLPLPAAAAVDERGSGRPAQTAAGDAATENDSAEGGEVEGAGKAVKSAGKEGRASTSSARIEAKLDALQADVTKARGSLTAIAIVTFVLAATLLRGRTSVGGLSEPTVRIKFGM